METNWKHLPKVPHNRQERRNRAPGASESKSQVLNCSTMSMIHITVACLCCDMTPRGHPGARVEAVAKPSKQLTIVYPDQIKSCKYTIYIYISLSASRGGMHQGLGQNMEKKKERHWQKKSNRPNRTSDQYVKHFEKKRSA